MLIRRLTVPLLLLLLTAGAITAVFIVHRIENRGGPFLEPYATRYFSPQSSVSSRPELKIRFNAQDREKVTVSIINARGETVDTVAKNREVHGETFLTWSGIRKNGAPFPNGEYRVSIRRHQRNDRRVYGPALASYLDSTNPVAVFDHSIARDNYWRGLIYAEPSAQIFFIDAHNKRYAPHELNGFISLPAANSSRAKPRNIKPPSGAVAYRFSVTVAADQYLRVVVVDRAGNETKLPADRLQRARNAASNQRSERQGET